VKIGAEDRKKVIVMAVLLLVALPLLVRNFGSFHTSSASSSPPRPAEANINHAVQKKGGIPKVRENTSDPTLRIDILAAAQKIDYKGGARNIFRMEEAPQPIPPVTSNVKTPPPPPPPPPAPPQIPLKFYGFSNRPGEPKKAFLQEGDNIFVAVEGEIVDRRYKIVRITNNFVLVEDVLNNNQQTINLTAPSPTG
jgi:hypothetical protein